MAKYLELEVPEERVHQFLKELQSRLPKATVFSRQEQGHYPLIRVELASTLAENTFIGFLQEKLESGELPDTFVVRSVGAEA